MRLEYFQMIDRVDALDRATKSLRAAARVPDGSTVFEGHFPGHPLVPGVLLVETMAQASGYLILALNGVARMPFLAGVEKAKLRRFVGPGAALTIEASMVHEGSGYSVTRAKISADGAAIAAAEMMFKTMPFPAEMEAVIIAKMEALGMSTLAN